MPDVAAPLEPLLLEPTLSRRLWGGDRLASFAGVDVGGDPTPVGELWTAFAGNRIVSGRYRGGTLAEVIAQQGADLLGHAAVGRYGLRMPLLAKFIDTAKPLSIQVHPDDAYATEVEAASGHLGKGEAWCVITAEQGGEIIWGWRRSVEPAEVRDRVADGSLESLLRRVPVAAGDVVYNPPGRVHAIGAGVFLFEIQQDSDLTYRLYDYGRRDADGNLRDLHLEKALAVADLAGSDALPLHPEPASESWGELVETPFFVLERIALGSGRDEISTPHSLAILTSLAGRPALRWSEGVLPMPPGTSVVVPARLGRYGLEGRGHLFRSSVPPAPA